MGECRRRKGRKGGLLRNMHSTIKIIKILFNKSKNPNKQTKKTKIGNIKNICVTAATFVTSVLMHDEFWVCETSWGPLDIMLRYRR